MIETATSALGSAGSWFGAISWTWTGAALLLVLAGGLLCWLGQIQLGLMCFAAAAGCFWVGDLYQSRDYAISQRLRAESDLTQRVEEAGKRVQEAEARVAKQNEDRRKFANDQKLKLQASSARVADLERRLRESSPVDSDGKPLSVSGSCPGEVQGTSEGRIPVADYRRAQAEALEAAVRVQEMRGYLTGLVDLGVLRWE